MNPTTFNSIGGTTLGKASVTLDHIYQPFGLAYSDLQSAHRLERLIQINLDAIMMPMALCADARLEKRVWMEQGANTTYIQYTLTRASLPLRLTVKPLVNYRDHHANTVADSLPNPVGRSYLPNSAVCASPSARCHGPS